MMLDCFVHIDLGHELCSQHTLNALEIRHQIETELENLGYDVCGGGMGCGGMDIDLTVPGENELSAKQAIETTIKKYGFTKFRIKFKPTETT